MAKVEVQIRHCCCCPLSIGSVFVALYTLFLYALLTGLALWALNNTANNNDQLYNSCELEAQGKINAENRKIQFQQGQTTVVIEDSTSYHCSFGLYTEELILSHGWRYTTLLFNITLYILLVIASVLLLIGLCIYNEWLLLPWIFLMAVDIIRGFITVLLIFIFGHWYLARIAAGIFFLGLQCLHVSLLLIIVAKFQRIHARRRGLTYDPRVYPSTTLPSNYYSPQARRDPYPYSDYSPTQKDSRFYDSTTYGSHQPIGPRY
ncbi:hypothetical protein M3Y99_01608700 [Aphelenchoides fujianensis]|nr:hypothetical protein M3Y99_01608700 [Aphelenchoides fujianensis]